MTTPGTPSAERRWSPLLGAVLVRIREARRRWYLSLLLSALLGLIVGLSLAGAETLINDGMLDPLRRAPLAVEVVVPAVGLIVIALVFKALGRGVSPFISDEYIRAYHDPSHPIDLASAPARIVSGVVTLGSGAAMGAEALGIYYGCVVSTILSGRFKHAGHVERRFELPVQQVMRPGGYTIEPSTTVDELLNVHAPTARARSIPVVDTGAIVERPADGASREER